jgi:putative ABC transport system permease protein
MRLALTEIRRAKLRFAMLTGAIALLVFLILFQQSLASSLLGQFTGGLEHQSAPVLVYAADARRSVEGSRILRDQAAAVARVDGVAEVAPIGEGSFTAVAAGASIDATVFGVDVGGPGTPTTLSEGRLPSSPGEAVASAADADDGFGVGDVVTIVPGDTDLTVVGLARDISFNVQPTLFVPYATFETIVFATNPAAQGVLPTLLGVEPAPGVAPDALAAAITADVPGVEALDRDTAVASLPGVSSIQQSFAIILGLALIVVVLLTGFFFLILTVQKTGALTLLRAVGARSSYLVRNLVLQVALVLIVALAVAIPLTTVAVRGVSRGGSFTATVDPGSVATTSALLAVLGLVASIAAIRRVTRIDPAAATGRLVGGGLA